MRSALLPLLLVAAAGTASAQSYQQHAELGLQRVRSGDYVGALYSFDAALRLNPRLARAHANRANALEKLQRIADACQAVYAAMELDRRDFLAGMVHDRIGGDRCATEVQAKQARDAERQAAEAAARRQEELRRQAADAAAERQQLERERQRLLAEQQAPPKQSLLGALVEISGAVAGAVAASKASEAEDQRTRALLDANQKLIEAAKRKQVEAQRQQVPVKAAAGGSNTRPPSNDVRTPTRPVGPTLPTPVDRGGTPTGGGSRPVPTGPIGVTPPPPPPLPAPSPAPSPSPGRGPGGVRPSPPPPPPPPRQRLSSLFIMRGGGSVLSQFCTQDGYVSVAHEGWRSGKLSSSYTIGATLLIGPGRYELGQGSARVLPGCYRHSMARSSAWGDAWVQSTVWYYVR